MGSRWLGPALFVTGSLLLAPVAGATPPTLIDQDRGVFARASALEAGAADEAVGPDEATDFSPFQSSVSPSASTTDASASATADVDSTLGASVFTASGGATSSAATTASDTSAEAPADSFFEVVFEATATESFFLDGTLDANATAGDGFASVELYDVDGASSVASHEVLSGQSDVFSDSGTLQAGVTYRLTAFGLSHARATSPGSSSGDASYDLVFALPEPSQPTSLAAGCAALLLLAGLRRSRGGRRP